MVTWFRRHVEVGKWGRATFAFAACLEGINAVFDFRDGKYGWAAWWGFVAAFALFAAIVAAPMPKKER